MGEENSDVELVRRMRTGDEDALRELVYRHAAWLTLRLRRRTSDEDLVQDTLQDTFVAAWRSARRYRGDGDVGAWLWGIAIRRLLSQVRRRGGPVPLPDAALTAMSPATASAEDELLLAVEHGDVGDALRSLSPQLRTALQATVLDGLTTREAARLLGVPHGTLKSRVRIAKAQLRRTLTDEAREGWA